MQELKVFLTASAEERAKRRYAELIERGAQPLFAEVLQDQLDRDGRDSSRSVSPLVPAKDAVHIDTDGQTVEGVVQAILKLNDERMAALGTTIDGET